jgi:hypothetical protein
VLVRCRGAQNEFTYRAMTGVSSEICRLSSPPLVQAGIHKNHLVIHGVRSDDLQPCACFRIANETPLANTAVLERFNIACSVVGTNYLSARITRGRYQQARGHLRRHRWCTIRELALIQLDHTLWRQIARSEVKFAGFHSLITKLRSTMVRVTRQAARIRTRIGNGLTRGAAIDWPTRARASKETRVEEIMAT